MSDKGKASVPPRPDKGCAGGSQWPGLRPALLSGTSGARTSLEAGCGEVVL